MPIYATMTELAKYYKISYHTIQKIVTEMKASGFGGVLYVGRMPRIDKDKFQEYLTKQTEEKINGTNTIHV